MRGVRCVGGAEVILPDVRTLLMPGVRSAATVFTVPMSGFAMAARATRRRGASAFEKRPLGVVEFITADYFRSIGSPCGAVASSRRAIALPAGSHHHHRRLRAEAVAGISQSDWIAPTHQHQYH
jgi:hypothetical protein